MTYDLMYEDVHSAVTWSLLIFMRVGVSLRYMYIFLLLAPSHCRSYTTSLLGNNLRSPFGVFISAQQILLIIITVVSTSAHEDTIEETPNKQNQQLTIRQKKQKGAKLYHYHFLLRHVQQKS